MRFYDLKSRYRETIGVGKEYSNAAPVTVLRFAFLSRVGAVGVIVNVVKGYALCALSVILGDPVGYFVNILGIVRAGGVQNLAAIARGSRVICAL